ncbi:MAG: alanine racemase [Gemmatimonadota bacterium]
MEQHGPWLSVDLSAIQRNARRFRDLVEVPLLPMVKANAYGLGAVSVARALESVRPWGFGVATVSEAEELRLHGFDLPIVVFIPLVPDLAERYRQLDARPVIGDLAALDAWLAGAPLPFHLEIDTGMARAGFRWDDAAAIGALRGRIADAPARRGYEGIFTHFHSADLDLATAGVQWDRLVAVVQALGSRPRFVHAAASAAGAAGRQFAGDLARPGLYLYGGRAGQITPEPATRLQARVVAVRTVGQGDSVSYGATWTADRVETIATLGIGYADGMLRSLSSRGRIELGGAVLPIAGRVTMDMTMVAAGAAAVKPGDVATVFGGLVSLDQHAEAAGTSAYEILTAIGHRVVRRYAGGAQG